MRSIIQTHFGCQLENKGFPWESLFCSYQNEIYNVIVIIAVMIVMLVTILINVKE